ncbi:unnamed protein product [Polarella glacialis]|uniref:Uncharacterized protein n=1 Tax=Polarella glacialis TaxID=89957 RepID=A0A813HM40_POLGL|nr:unnamed protein product [Polarella glacialis]
MCQTPLSATDPPLPPPPFSPPPRSVSSSTPGPQAQPSAPPQPALPAAFRCSSASSLLSTAGVVALPPSPEEFEDAASEASSVAPEANELRSAAWAEAAAGASDRETALPTIQSLHENHQSHEQSEEMSASPELNQFVPLGSGADGSEVCVAGLKVENALEHLSGEVDEHARKEEEEVPAVEFGVKNEEEMPETSGEVVAAVVQSMSPSLVAQQSQLAAGEASAAPSFDSTEFASISSANSSGEFSFHDAAALSISSSSSSLASARSNASNAANVTALSEEHCSDALAASPYSSSSLPTISVVVSPLASSVATISVVVVSPTAGLGGSFLEHASEVHDEGFDPQVLCAEESSQALATTAATTTTSENSKLPSASCDHGAGSRTSSASGSSSCTSMVTADSRASAPGLPQEAGDEKTQDWVGQRSFGSWTVCSFRAQAYCFSFSASTHYTSRFALVSLRACS